MCGRFILGDSSWAAYHDALTIIREVRGDVSFNIKPTETVSIVVSSDSGPVADRARWWFVPNWFKGDQKDWKATTFNARIETASEKPVFRGAWRNGRCLIPASGYYEWTGEKGKKQPWFVTVEQNAPVFFFAGLQSIHNGLRTCTILTRAADPAIAYLHPRMPVVLTGDELEPWLAGRLDDDVAVDTLGTSWADRFTVRRVRPFGISDDGPELIEQDGFDL